MKDAHCREAKKAFFRKVCLFWDMCLLGKMGLFRVRGNTPVSVPIYFVQTKKFVQVNRVVLDFLFVYFFQIKEKLS